MTKVKKIGILIIVFVISTFIAYYIWSGVKLSNKDIDINNYAGEEYVSLDNQIYLSFGDLKTIRVFDNDTLIKFNNINYDSAVIELKLNNDSNYILIMDENTLFYNEYNKVLYKVVK